MLAKCFVSDPRKEPPAGAPYQASRSPISQTGFMHFAANSQAKIRPYLKSLADSAGATFKDSVKL